MTGWWIVGVTALALAVEAALAWHCWRHRKHTAATAAAKARHLQLAGEHQCCRVVNAVQCGLWCCHDGRCVDYGPGDYLPLPLIGPLDRLLLGPARWPWMRCPLCGTQVDDVLCEHTTVMRWDDDGWQGSPEFEWRFSPCGCEGREVL